MIWSSQELNNIKKIILSRSNLKLNDKGELVKSYVESPVMSRTDIANTNYLYELHAKELESLLFIEDKKEIIRVLNKTRDIEVDPTNPIYFGFVMSVAKINPNKPEEIFIIFKEIIALYEKTISKVAKLIIANTPDIEDLQERTYSISKSTEITEEEKLIKSEVNKLFNMVNGVADSDLFVELINSLDVLTKTRLLKKLNEYINKIIKEELKNKTKSNKDYANELHYKIKKRRH